MNIIRNHVNGSFTAIPNGLIEDNSLSDRSRFLYITLVNKPKNWIFYTRQLSESLGMHTDTFRKYRDELRLKGWISLEKQKYNKKGNFQSRVYHLYDSPIKMDDNNFSNNSNQQKERKKPSRKKTDTVKNGDGKIPTLSNKNSNTINTKTNKNNKYIEDPKNSSNQNPNPR